MSRNKSHVRKKVLAKRLRQNRRVPVFVMAKTMRRVMRNTKTRNWRRQKLGLKKDGSK